MLSRVITNINYNIIEKHDTISMNDKLRAVSLLQLIIQNIDNRINKLKYPKSLTVNLKIKCNSMPTENFKIKYSDSMSKALEFYTKKHGLNKNSYIIIKDDYPVTNSTYKSLELEDGEMIEIFKKPEPEPETELFIKTLTGQTITLSCRLSDYVFGLKLLLEEKESIPPKQQKMIFSGKLLENMKTLADYNIRQHSTIHLILSIKGGMFHISSAKLDYKNYKKMLNRKNFLDEIQKDINKKKSEELESYRGQIVKMFKYMINYNNKN